MTSPVFVGFSDYDADGVLNSWFNGATPVAPSNYWVGLLSVFPTDGSGDGLSEPWVPAPTINTITSASTGGSIHGGTTRYYVVTEVNGSGETTGSIEVSYVVPAGTNTNVVTVSWTGSGDAGDTFNVYESATSGSEVLVGSGISLSYFNDHGGTIGSGPPTTNTTGWGYQRVEIAATTTNFPVANGRQIANGVAVAFPAPTETGAWPTLIGWAAFDGPTTNARFRMCGGLLVPVTVPYGTPPQFAPGTLITSVGVATGWTPM